MRRRTAFLAICLAAALAGAPAAMAGPVPDWVRDLIEESPAEGSGDGDHEVGEELCARPGLPLPR